MSLLSGVFSNFFSRIYLNFSWWILLGLRESMGEIVSDIKLSVLCCSGSSLRLPPLPHLRGCFSIVFIYYLLQFSRCNFPLYFGFLYIFPSRNWGEEFLFCCPPHKTSFYWGRTLASPVWLLVFLWSWLITLLIMFDRQFMLLNYVP